MLLKPCYLLVQSRELLPAIMNMPAECVMVIVPGDGKGSDDQMDIDVDMQAECVMVIMPGDGKGSDDQMDIDEAAAREDSQRAAVITLSDSEDMPEPAKTFVEIFSPPRVAPHAEARGLTSVGSFDIVTGCDLLTWSGRAQVLNVLNDKSPLFMVSSPPCTMYSELMRLWNLKKMEYETRKLRQHEADILLTFGMESCRLQHERRRFWVHEHPHRASSWKTQVAP